MLAITWLDKLSSWTVVCPCALSVARVDDGLTISKTFLLVEFREVYNNDAPDGLVVTAKLYVPADSGTESSSGFTIDAAAVVAVTLVWEP